jgi:5-methylcytosine-specific restriction enzyme subunit McrC
VSSQLKRGLGREYVDRTDTLSTLRGKIEVSESVKTRSVLRRQMVCSYDEFSVDTRMNRILRATMLLLMRSDINKTRKKELKRLLVYFGDVGDIDLATVDWRMRFDRNNQTYRMLMNVCWLVAKGLLQTQADGPSHLMDFLDEQRMCRLYEKFILEYYRKEHPGIKASASQIPWQLDDDFSSMLPVMQTDIMLSKGNTVLIIDAKYYCHTTQSQYGVHTLHSGNLYQVFTYVKNKDAEFGDEPHTVSGMLLYAQTDEAVQPNHVYHMSGNKISVRTLDLNCPFKEIAAHLDSIITEHFN